MFEIFVSVLGKPAGIITFQLCVAMQFTIYLSLIAFLGGGLVAAIITILRIYPLAGLNALASSYIWLFQSIPLLMLLFLSGLGIPRLFQVDIDPWFAATVSLVIFTSAYLADVWRGAIENVAKGQWEAASALKLDFILTFRLVILPQALRFALAPTISFLVQIIKGTSLAYIIGFQDLMLLGKRWANAPVVGSEPFIVFPLMAVLYFSLCYPLALYARWLEKRIA